MAFSGNQITHVGIGAPISRAGRDFSNKTLVPVVEEPAIPLAGPADTTTNVLLFPETPIINRIRVVLVHDWQPKIYASMWDAAQHTHPSAPLIAHPVPTDMSVAGRFKVSNTIVLGSVLALRYGASVASVMAHRMVIDGRLADVVDPDIMTTALLANPILMRRVLVMWMESSEAEARLQIDERVDNIRVDMIKEVHALAQRDRMRRECESWLGIGGDN